MKIYNTKHEIGCRILIILNTIQLDFSIERIIYYDYYSLHFADLKNDEESLHPSNPNHISEFFVKKYYFSDIINYLIQKGLIVPIYNNQGIKYKNTELGNNLVQLLDNIYAQKYQCYVKKVDDYLKNKNDQKIKLFFNKKVI